MSEQNKKMVRRTIDEVLNRGNFAVADQLIAGKYIGHSPPNETYGPEGVTQRIGAMRSALLDLHFADENQIAEGDRVVTRWTARGTHKGEVEGLPTTGKRATVPGITIDLIANDKVVEGWMNWDALGPLQQLGAVPASERAG